MKSNNILEITHLVKNYQDTKDEIKAIDDFSYNVSEGKFISIVGPSGCGKSTLLSILAKLEDKSRLNDVLYVILDGIRLCAIELEAFIPATSKKIYEQINVNDASFENNTIGYVESYQVTEKPEILFARIDEKELKEKLEAKEIEHLPEISIDDFAKMEMVVGEVLESKKHEKADKLLVSKVDIGGEVRQIVSGIAEHVDPKEFVGKKVVVLANLKPVKIRGVESQGMIICAENEGKIEVVTSSLPAGSKLS